VHLKAGEVGTALGGDLPAGGRRASRSLYTAGKGGSQGNEMLQIQRTADGPEGGGRCDVKSKLKEKVEINADMQEGPLKMRLV